MAYDEALAERVRRALGRRDDISERAMFGGLAFLVDGKMFVGVNADDLMVRVGPDRHAEALALPHVRPMDFTGRPMRGYVFVNRSGVADDRAVAAWVAWSVAYVSALPAKAKAKAQAKAKTKARSR